MNFPVHFCCHCRSTVQWKILLLQRREQEKRGGVPVSGNVKSLAKTLETKRTTFQGRILSLQLCQRASRSRAKDVANPKVQLRQRRPSHAHVVRGPDHRGMAGVSSTLLALFSLFNLVALSLPNIRFRRHVFTL